MKQKLKTSLAFAKNIFVTGAFSETSKKVEREICRYVPSEENKVVVEFGVGHGNITRAILDKMGPGSRLYAFEVNAEFCAHVRKAIPDERLILVNDGAENLKKHVQEEVHAVISSIPFSFFSEEKGIQIIQDAYDLLAPGAYFSQVLYTRFNFKKFQRVFDQCEMKTIPNIPIEYLYYCRKGKV